jgi:hypothetical protein
MSATSRALVHNWRLKAAALGLAVFLWALVQTEPRSEETFTSVPVRVDISDTTWTLGELPSPASVELRLDGPAREIIRLAREGTSIRIPVTSVGSRDTIVTIRRDWVDLSQRAGLVVVSVSPSAVRLALEPAVTRLVPVSMRIQGRVRGTLALATEVGVNPQLVRIRGAESRVAPLDSIPLHAFDLGRVTGSGVYTVPVDTTGLGGATVTPPNATLGIRVEDLVERVLDGLPVEATVGPGEAPVVIDPIAVRLTLSGARTVVTSLDPALLRVWVPPEYLEGMAPGEERRVRVLVEGVPDLVTAVPGTDYVTARRAIDLVGGGEEESPGS